MRESRWVYATSKFCRETRKCVDDYDHHCLWLNNAIGRPNYSAFLAALCSAAGLVLTQVGGGGASIAAFFADRAEFDARSAGPSIGSVPLLAVLCVQVFLLLIGLAFILQLLGFHVYLMSNGLTTYEFMADWDRRRAAQAAGLDGFEARYMNGTAVERRARRSKIAREHAALEADRMRLRALVWADVQAAVAALGPTATVEVKRSTALATATAAYTKRKSQVLSDGQVAALARAQAAARQTPAHGNAAGDRAAFHGAAGSAAVSAQGEAGATAPSAFHGASLDVDAGEGDIEMSGVGSPAPKAKALPGKASVRPTPSDEPEHGEQVDGVEDEVEGTAAAALPGSAESHPEADSAPPSAPPSPGPSGAGDESGEGGEEDVEGGVEEGGGEGGGEGEAEPEETDEAGEGSPQGDATAGVAAAEGDAAAEGVAAEGKDEAEGKGGDGSGHATPATQ